MIELNNQPVPSKPVLDKRTVRTRIRKDTDGYWIDVWMDRWCPKRWISGGTKRELTQAENEVKQELINARA